MHAGTQARTQACSRAVGGCRRASDCFDKSIFMPILCAGADRLSCAGVDCRLRRQNDKTQAQMSGMAVEAKGEQSGGAIPTASQPLIHRAISKQLVRKSLAARKLLGASSANRASALSMCTHV